MWHVDGAKLRALRLAKTMTVGQLADRACVDEKTIREIEAGNRTARKTTLESLAKALATDVPALLAPPASDAPPAPPASAAPAAPATATPDASRRRQRSELGRLVDIDLTLEPPPLLDGPHGPTAALTPRILQNLFTAFAAHADERFYVRGLVDDQHGVGVREAQLLGGESGVAARFHLLLEFVPGETLGVTVHSRDVDSTRRLLNARGRVATAFVRVVVAPRRDDASARDGFAFFLSERPRPWALVVELVRED